MNLENITGGPAFPRPASEAMDSAGQRFYPPAFSGMTLLDYFAGQALASLIVSCKVRIGSETDGEIVIADPVEVLAAHAYDIARSMIVEKSIQEDCEDDEDSL